MNGSWKVRLFGNLLVNRSDMKISVNDAPLEWQLITAMELADINFEIGEGSVLIKHTELKSEVLAAIDSVCHFTPPPGMAQPAEELECEISSIAFGRLILFRNEMHGAPESEIECLGAVKMLLALDELGVIDAETINALLGGPTIEQNGDEEHV